MNNSNDDLYALQWNNHTKLLKGAFETFRSDSELVDVTISCEGKRLKAHKIVLSACSSYFLDLFRDNPCQHPIVILRDIKYQNMVDILNFMYVGEVNVGMEYLDAFLQTAEYLQVKGLTEDSSSKISNCLGNVIPDNSQVTQKIETETMMSNEKTSQFTPPNCSNSDKIKSQLGSVQENNAKSNIESLQTPFLKTEYIDMEEVNESNSVEFIDGDLSLTQNDNTSSDSFSTLSVLDGFSRNPNLDVENMSNKGFPCPHCKKIFNHSGSLRLHLPKHSGGTSCALCHAVLSRKYELKIHMRRKHNIDMNILYTR